MALNQLQIGQQNIGDGATIVARGGQQADQSCSFLHGKYYEQSARGNVYCGGISNTASATTNAIVTGVGAAATPVIGLWNPNPRVNLSILQAIINLTTSGNASASPAGYMWLYNTGQNAITTGSTPINVKTLTSVGTMTKFFPVNVALTGMTGSLTVLRASHFNTINAPQPATAISQTVNNPAEMVEGGIIVPPYGVIAIMQQASSTTLASYSVGIIWEEVPIL